MRPEMDERRRLASLAAAPGGGGVGAFGGQARPLQRGLTAAEQQLLMAAQHRGGGPPGQGLQVRVPVGPSGQCVSPLTSSAPTPVTARYAFGPPA